MTLSLSKSTLLSANVTALTLRTTALGDRIYAVFQATDGSTLGFWANADHPVLKTLCVGDPIMLRRKANGRLTLAEKPSASAHPNAHYSMGVLTHVHTQFNRLWRLL